VGVGCIDYEGRAADFRRARTLPADVLHSWSIAVGAVAPSHCRVVLDVGAGPGGFLRALREWCGPHAIVVALEPSAAMRAEGVGAGVAGPFPFVGGRAERLPFGDGTVDAAWLSTAFHQFDDRVRAAAELRRVIRPGGHVLVRGFFADVPVTGLLAEFPGIERSAATFPSTQDVRDAFGAAGFACRSVTDVVEPWRFGLETWAAMVWSMRAADSALRPLTDDEIRTGIDRVRVRHDQAPGPVANDLTLRLLVFS
jgi:SAM-dependent methyltransferase